MPDQPPITQADYQERVDRLMEILGGIISHSARQTASRCPYKNRHNCCTAQFGCRNKRKPEAPGELPVCAGDDRIDYRPAWQA
ncbi:MAG: hypothetical protein FJW40_07560 [Acidobacteria bacterium]|nr:hypothetical protein [Acidobacteriota bacterium]